MKAIIEKGIARGYVTAPPSKSMAHRLLIAAAMCEGVSVVRGIPTCEDVLATVECLSALGVSVKLHGECAEVEGRSFLHLKPARALDCHESGSTARFIIPPAMLSGKDVTLVGRGRLLSRPMSVYEDVFSKKGVFFSHGAECIKACGPLTAGEYEILGGVSSQFISGLIFALPLLDGDSIIKIIPPFESRPYVDLTLAAVRQFGISAYFADEYTIKIPGNQRYTPATVTVEGDWSGAAFPDALNLFGGEVNVLGLDPDSLQSDAAYKKYFPALNREYCEIDLSDCPDLAPILFTVAAAKHGAKFINTKRLRMKESDRCEAMATELKKFGAKIDIYDNEVVVTQSELHAPTDPLYGHNDHRIVMSLAVLLTVFGGEISGAEAVAKSYPDFFRDLSRLNIGVTLNEV